MIINIRNKNTLHMMRKYTCTTTWRCNIIYFLPVKVPHSRVSRDKTRKLISASQPRTQGLGPRSPLRKEE